VGARRRAEPLAGPEICPISVAASRTGFRFQKAGHENVEDDCCKINKLAYIMLSLGNKVMPTFAIEREIAFNISDVARLLRTYADQRAREFGMTRAQWAVLSRVERTEGLKQNELAEALDLQPITLTRLIDRLCESGLIERRSDPDDRRAKRLYLTPAARPVLDGLMRLGKDMMATVLAGIEPAAVEQLLANLLTLKTNLRGAIANRANEAALEQSHG
jgi:MarR family transcriptional regulator, transcriptional regulator for hemolysin